MGNAVLHILVSVELYKLHPATPHEGLFSDLHSAAISNEKLSIYAAQSGLAQNFSRRVPNLKEKIAKVKTRASTMRWTAKILRFVVLLFCCNSSQVH